MAESRHYYVTTPIYYVTARPHLGSLYSTLLADVMMRWHRLQGDKTFFLTGTDEYGQKVAQAAQKAGMEPQAFVDQFISSFKKTWHDYQIDYTDFIRTTDKRHKVGVHAFVQKLLEKGDIYKSVYEGWYCTPCETFVTKKDQKTVDVQAPLCGSCGRPTTHVSEETYFFRLSAYQDRLLKFYKDNPHFILPRERANEVISFVQEGLKDLSISRTTIPWGIPFPNDPAHTIYVWIDALCNYITALGYGDPEKKNYFEEWWPASLQILGKDIVRFHAVYWPALLMAADLPLPKQLLVHGWIKVDQQKMSKSFGNVIDPTDLYERYGADPVRYYLCRQIPINQDGEFSIADLEQRITSDLANDLGNLLNRMLVLAEKNTIFDVKAPETWSQEAMALRENGWNAIEDFERHMLSCEIHLALARLWRFIAEINSYFHAQEPWKLAKNNAKAFKEVLSATAHALRIVGVLLWPIMPKKMEELLASLGQTEIFENNTIEKLELGAWRQEFLFKKGDTLFTKPEPQEVKEEQPAEKPDNYIAIDDVAKVDLRVGTIVACEPVTGSDKLLRMMVDCGDAGMRQILGGIAKYFSPEELIGKQGLFITNLKPRKMLGLESQGMMLLAEDADGKLQIMSPSAPVPKGTKLR